MQAIAYRTPRDRKHGEVVENVVSMIDYVRRRLRLPAPPPLPAIDPITDDDVRATMLSAPAPIGDEELLTVLIRSGSSPEEAAHVLALRNAELDGQDPELWRMPSPER